MHCHNATAATTIGFMANEQYYVGLIDGYAHARDMIAHGDFSWRSRQAALAALDRMLCERIEDLRQARARESKLAVELRAHQR